MKKLFFILLFGLFIQACTSPVEPAPDDVISARKMTSILVDIHVAEARVERLGITTDTAAVHFRKLQQEVYRKHQITEEQFNKSYNYYMHNVSELDKIYEKVVDSLSVNEVEAARTPVAPPQ